MKLACLRNVGLVLILCFLTPALMGQPKFKVQYYSTEQGLSHQAVTSIFKDKEGFMWFGTWDGINRFDGKTFVPYKSLPGDISILGNSRVDQLVEDAFDHIWMLTYDKQIYRFDKKTGQVLSLSSLIDTAAKQKTTFNRILSINEGLVWLQSVNEGIFCLRQENNQVKEVLKYHKTAATGYRLPSDTMSFYYQDNERRIWIGTPGGLCRLDKLSTGTYQISHTTPTKTQQRFISVEEDSKQLYFATVSGDLLIFNKATGIFSNVTISNNQINGFLRSRKSDFVYATTSSGEIVCYNIRDNSRNVITYPSGESLRSIVEDRSGHLWIEPEKLGAIRLEPFTGSFRVYSDKNAEGLNYIGNRFRVVEDSSNTIWINMKGGGFGYYNAITDSIDSLLHTTDAGTYRLPRVVYTIYYDNTGVIWLTTDDREVIKIVPQENDFAQQLLVDNARSRLDNDVRGMLYDNKDRLWLGVKKGVLYVYQNGQRVTDLFVNEPAEGLGVVYSMLQDSHGNIWVGTKGNGLYKASPVNEQQTKYYLTHFYPSGSNNNLPCKEIYALLEDKRGRLWIGSFDKGLFMVDVTADSTTFIPADNLFKNYPTGTIQKIRHLALDGNNNIWVATSNGLLLLSTGNNHPSQKNVSFYKKIQGERESLGNNDIQFILRDSKNRMWLATSGGGLSLAIGQQPFQSLLFRNYTTRDGMPNDYVLSCTESKTGNLWIATENGLSKFNPEKQIFRNYNSYDGLPKVSFSEAAVCQRLKDGEIFFGTSKGVLSFAPNNINKNQITADIAFTKLQINNEDVGPRANQPLLQSDINFLSELSLKYNQNIISVDYALLDHRSGDRKAFVYRLLGFDSTWHNDQYLGRATYTNLPPGHYVFEVKAMSTDQYKNTPYKQLVITISSPPWKTWWAYLLYGIFMIIILVGIWRYTIYIARLRQKIAFERKLAALKVDFFTNISHELRTPLTLIVNPLEQLARKEKLSAEAASFVDVALKNAGRMVRFINQLLDLRKVQSDKAALNISRVEIVSFVNKIKDYFSEAAKSKQITLDVESDQPEIIASVDAEKLDVVLYNLLANAVKFTPAGRGIKVFIHTIAEEQSFVIIVSDQGPGVDKSKLETIFELFYEGELPIRKERKGTGIGLALSREFVKLQGGQIWASNNDDGGLTVSVKLKVGVEHFEQKNVPFIDMDQMSMAREAPTEPPLILQTPATTVTDQDAPLVLLVEDNDELRSFLKGQLSEYYRVETAKDGQEGFDKAVHLIPDLIVSDIMMPVMDGIEMLDKIKNDVNTSHIPVVLLSAKYSIESQIEGLTYGADYYITKPFNNDFLVASINNLLRQRKKLFEHLVENKKPLDVQSEPAVVTSKDETFLKEVISVVESKMAEAGFNIDQVAESMAMGRTTFYKKFKSLAGMTPIEFVRDMRLQRAKQYLDTGGMNVSEVAYLAGFNNPKYFSTCFKEKYNVSPSDYQKIKPV